MQETDENYPINAVSSFADKVLSEHQHVNISTHKPYRIDLPGPFMVPQLRDITPPSFLAASSPSGPTTPFLPNITDLPSTEEILAFLKIILEQALEEMNKRLQNLTLTPGTYSIR